MRSIFIFLLFIETCVLGQSPAEFFNHAANEYIYQNEQVALNTIGTGLTKYPGDKNLSALKEKIEKDKQEQEQQKKEDQEKKEQEEQEKKEQEEQQQKQEDKEKEEEQQKQQEQDEQSEEEKNADEKDQAQQAEPEETEEEGKEMDEPPQSRSEKLEELNLTEEKAKMILEAMKNNEIQYIQQNKRKATKKPDSSKPDW